jgi:hypothetical protein
MQLLVMKLLFVVVVFSEDFIINRENIKAFKRQNLKLLHVRFDKAR